MNYHLCTDDANIGSELHWHKIINSEQKLINELKLVKYVVKFGGGETVYDFNRNQGTIYYFQNPSPNENFKMWKDIDNIPKEIYEERNSLIEKYVNECPDDKLIRLSGFRLNYDCCDLFLIKSTEIVTSLSKEDYKVMFPDSNRIFK